MSFTDLFPHVIVINLKRRPDRKVHMQEQLRKAGINATFFEAIDGQSPQVQQQHRQYLQLPLRHTEELRWKQKLLTNPAMFALMLSAQSVVGRAFASQWPSLLVMEDDVLLCPDFTTKVAQFMSELKSWKMVAFGASDFHYQERRYANPHRYEACRGVYGFFCVGIHNSVFKELLQLLQLQSLPPDVCLNCVYEKYPRQCWVPFPNLAIAKLDDSDVHPYQKNRLVTREGQSKETGYTSSLTDFETDYKKKAGWDSFIAL